MPKKPSKPPAPKPDPQRKLFEKLLDKACYASDFSAAKSLLTVHPDLATAPQPILNTAYVGAPEIMELLLANGADANAVSKTAGHHRPLHRICEHKKTAPRHDGHVACVKLLLAAGGDPTARATWLRVTPLALAAFAGLAEITEVLIRPTSPLDIFHAAAVADEDRVAALMKRDPELAHKRDINDMTPLMYAVASRLGQVSKLTAKSQAAIVAKLLAAGANPSAAIQVGEHTKSTVSFAVPNPAMVQLVLKAGAEPNSALINALWESDYDTAKLLLDYGADPKHREIAPYVGGFAHWGHFEQSRWLIEHGAPVDAMDKYNTTALQAAARRGARGDFVEFLIEHNANPLATTDEGRTPYDLAREAGKDKLLPLLKKAQDRANLHAPGEDTTEDDEFETGLPEHMKSKKKPKSK